MRRLGPVLEFMRALWALDHAFQSASKRMERRFGVTAPQRIVVRIVGRFPGISAGEVAEILHLHPSTLTGVLKRLQARGVVLRTTDPADGRRALLSLTARGRKIDALRSGTVEATVQRVLSGRGAGDGAVDARARRPSRGGARPSGRVAAGDLGW
ncbi:MAG TPA: MarR family transcriptional regulator [Anaeromyxobacter sp.]